MLVAYVVVSAALAGWSLWRANTQAHSLERALDSPTSARASAAVKSLRHDFFWAHLATRGPVWWTVAQAPVLGDQVDAVRAIADVGDDLTHGPGADLVADPRRLRGLAPRHGRNDTTAVAALAGPVHQTTRQLDAAVARLDEVGDRWAVPPLRRRFERFRGLIDRAASGMHGADRAVRVLPAMLGQDGPRRYLLLLDNNAEIRATGGLPGALAVIEADHGKVTLQRQLVPRDLPVFPHPVLPQSAAESAIYSDQVATFPQDTNFTPEFPRTADLLREMWRQAEHQDLDGVLSIDVVTMSYILRATGPLTVPGGPTLTSDNATSELINKVYTRIPDGTQQNDYFAAVARAMFEKVVGGVQSVPALASAFGQAASEGRVYVHDFDASVQRGLAGTAVAGELPVRVTHTPEVGVYLNDATGAKMSYFLRTSVRVRATSCHAGVQRLDGRAEVSYPASSPPLSELNDSITGDGSFGTPKGEQLLLVRVYGPVGGTLGDVRVGGQDTPVTPVVDRGRPVATLAVQLKRGDSVPVTWRMAGGHDQTASPRLAVTPGLAARPAVTETASACRTE